MTCLAGVSSTGNTSTISVSTFLSPWKHHILEFIPTHTYFYFLASICPPVLEEVLQSLADGVLLLDGQQVLQLLAEGAAVDSDTGWQDLGHPLQGAEHGGASALCGNAAAPHRVLLRHGERGRAILHYQGGHGAASLQHGHHLLVGRGPKAAHIMMCEGRRRVSLKSVSE